MSTRHHAFTLIEVMISLALGLVIIGTVYAGFRVAGQSITVSERLSLENKLLVAGFTMALDDVDTWDSLDHPGHQPLRTNPSSFKSIATWRGGYDRDGNDWRQLPQPFTAFSSSWTKSGVNIPYEADWPVHDPRSWYRGDGGLTMNMKTLNKPGGDQIPPAGDRPLPPDSERGLDCSVFGNYALFSCVQQELPASQLPAIRMGGRKDPTLTPVTETWLPSQHRALAYTLGWYGWMNYLPANAFIDYYAVGDLAGDLPGNNNGTELGRACKPFELEMRFDTNEPMAGVKYDFQYLHLHGRFAVQSGENSKLLISSAGRAATRGSFLYSSQVGISGPSPRSSDEDSAAYAVRQKIAARINRVHSGTFYDALKIMPDTGKPYGRINAHSILPTLIVELNQDVDVVAQRPGHWPQVLNGVRRFMKHSRVVNQCFVRVVDPISGAAQELSFPAVGSTLRGARLNRNLDQ